MQQESENVYLEAALKYLRESGLAVIPVRNKKPLVEWKQYQHRLPTEEEVRGWWTQWSDAGIAVICGAISNNLAAFDIDDPELFKKISQDDNVAGVLVSQTPSGGGHVFVYESGVSGHSGPLVPGVADLKAEGGYVVVPPTPGYEWVINGEPLEVADARQFAVMMLRKHGVQIEPDVRKQPAYEVLKDGVVREGERNTTLFSLACLLWQKGFGEDAIDALILSVNKALCRPPLPDAEVYTICRSATGYLRTSTTPQPYKGNGVVELVPVDLSTLSEPPKRVELIDLLLPTGCITNSFGDGGQGKSYMALILATHIVLGRPFFGRAVQQANVLYLDWELEQDEMARRAFKVARGMGLEQPPAGLKYLCMTEPLPKVIEAMRTCVLKHEIGLVIIDSFGAASPGDPELARTVIEIMAALRSLRTTILVIDHQAKMQIGQSYETKSPFGSVYKGNLSRSVIQTQCVKREKDKGEIHLALRHNKFNFGPLAEPTVYCLKFSSTADGKEVVTLTLSDVPPPSDKKETAAVKVMNALAQYGPGTANKFADRTGLAIGTVVNVFTKLTRAGVTKVIEKEGNAQVYDLSDNSTTPQDINGNGVVEQGQE